MKKYVLFTGLSMLLGYSVSAQQKEFSWLPGTWKMKDKNVFEVWKVAKDGKTLEGTSYRVKGADTVVMEQIRFTYADGAYHYIPDVAGDQGPVDFKVSRHSAEGFVAENPKHDFPKIIRYRFLRKESADVLEASIEGDGKIIPYVFERVR